jgi:hypothetical protein
MSEIKLVYDIEEHSDPEAFVQLLSSMSLLTLSLVNESLQRWFRPLLERPVTLPRCEYNYKKAATYAKLIYDHRRWLGEDMHLAWALS